MTDWLRGATFYQIYPRSFRDTDGDGVGDLRGVAEKLGYIASLGVDAIWLSPFFTSPMLDYGYDVADYRGVDPMFGAMADFDAVVERAHKLGLKVVIDQVYSHSSDRHPWFQQSRSNHVNDYADWYVWADAKPDGSPPNNWQAMFGGPSWTWDSRRRQYYLHNFLPSQPDLNVHNEEVQDALLDTAKFWLERGVDGFRLDVVNFYMHDLHLRDNPALSHLDTPARPHQFQHHLFDRTQPETLHFVARLRALLDQYGAMSVGEIEDEDPLTVQQLYTNGEDRLHTAYSFYLLRTPAITPAIIRAAMQGWEDARGWPSWSLSNHDVVRFPTRLCGDDPDCTKQLMALLLCLRGAIFLYQGDELGLPHAEIAFERLRDPEAIAFWPNGIGRDGARAPMPWVRDAHVCGFSDAEEGWLPLDPRYRDLAVDVQEADPESMLAFTRAMIVLRNANPALRLGDFIWHDTHGNQILFERLIDGQRLVCMFNLSGQEEVLETAFTGEPVWRFGESAPAPGGMRLGPFSALILQCEPD